MNVSTKIDATLKKEIITFVVFVIYSLMIKKDIYHCENVVFVVLVKDYFHCDKCCMCLPKVSKKHIIVYRQQNKIVCFA